MRLRKANGWAAAGLLAISVTACNRSEPVATERDTTLPQTEQNRAGGNVGVTDDARITTSVMARYQADGQLRGSNIDVTTNDGVVTLRGTVESEEAKNQALSAARQVEGVTQVNDELQVGAAQATTGNAERADGRRAERSDAEGTPGWITTKIQAQYFVNPDIKPWNIDVTTTSDGVVTLSGEIEDAADREEALRIARATEGVTRVEDQLRVRGETAATTGTADNRDTEATRSEGTPSSDGERTAIEQPDAWLTSKVQAKYFMDADVKGRDVNVETQNGVVTLKGTVDSEAERRQAIALARNTDGVREVRDQLQVRAAGSSTTAANRNDGRSGRQTSTVANDTWITTKIQSKYFLDADVKGNDINVEARNGVVTLKGTVENEAQKQAATQIARETDGVTRVVDQLTVGSARGNAQDQGERR